MASLAVWMGMAILNAFNCQGSGANTTKVVRQNWVGMLPRIRQPKARKTCLVHQTFQPG